MSNYPDLPAVSAWRSLSLFNVYLLTFNLFLRLPKHKDPAMRIENYDIISY